MSACLVQQLFRQKIKRELDPGVVNDFIFPFIRQRKHPQKELLVDIKLTRSICYGSDHHPDSPLCENLSPFELPLVARVALDWRRSLGRGRVTDSTRRRRRVEDWGTINILNELRELRQPQFGKHPPRNSPNPFPRKHLKRTEFEDMYILLKDLPPWSSRQEKRLSDLKFMNDYLEYALNTDSRISWVSSPSKTPSMVLTTRN
jgi:hypothetical protein